MARIRLDQELVDRGLVSSRSRARRAIRDGFVAVDGATVQRPGVGVPSGAGIEVASSVGRFVSQGGEKLEAALEEFEIQVEGRSAVDVGASTGGFTDALLQRAAGRVTAVDVGHGQLDRRLRTDPRVEVREGVNVRSADRAGLGGPFDLVVADLSFISLGLVAANLAGLGHEGSDWVVLVKPQFEVGRAAIGKGGVVRSAAAREEAIVTVARSFATAGLTAVGAIASPVLGGSGNREALLWLRTTGVGLKRSELVKVLADE